MHRIALPALTLLALGAACESRLTGNEGNFQFSYQADDRVLDFNKPVAVGARLDVDVVDVGAQQPVALSAAETDDPGVLDVDAFSGNTVTVLGTGSGNTLLRVEGTTASGEALADNVNLLARVPEVHLLSHTCVTGADGVYLTGQTIYVPFEFEMSNGQPVIGYGYYPVTVSEPAALVMDGSFVGSQFMAFETAAAALVTLTSEIDGTAVTLDLVEEAAIDGAQEPIAWVLEDIDVGDTNPFYVRPTVGGRPVCQAEATLAVQSDTPDLCEVTVAEPPPGGDATEHENGWFEVKGVAAGECLYTVTFPAGSAGAGASAQFSFPIEP